MAYINNNDIIIKIQCVKDMSKILSHKSTSAQTNKWYKIGIEVNCLI